jgi:hypothetical protein
MNAGAGDVPGVCMDKYGGFPKPGGYLCARDRAEILFCLPLAGKKDWSDSPVPAFRPGCAQILGNSIKTRLQVYITAGPDRQLA